MKTKQLLISTISLVLKIVVAVLVINFVYTMTVKAYDFGYRVFTEEPVSPAPGRDVSVAITEGKSSMDIAQILAEKGLVRDANLCFAQIIASEYRTTMKPGIYELNTSMTTDEMLLAMSPADEEEETE